MLYVIVIFRWKEFSWPVCSCNVKTCFIFSTYPPFKQNVFDKTDPWRLDCLLAIYISLLNVSWIIIRVYAFLLQYSIGNYACTLIFRITMYRIMHAVECNVVAVHVSTKYYIINYTHTFTYSICMGYHIWEELISV